MSIVHTPGLDSEQFENNDSCPPHSPHLCATCELSMLDRKFSQANGISRFARNATSSQPAKFLAVSSQDKHGPMPVLLNKSPEGFRSKTSTLKRKGTS